MKMSAENLTAKVMLPNTARSKKFLALTVILAAAVLLMMTGEASAHRMMIEEISEGKIEVGFDDGTVAENVEVELYDGEENLVDEGVTDEEGIYEFDTAMEVERIVASDDMGHRAVLTPESDQENKNFLQVLPLWLRTSTGVGILLLIAGAGKFYKARKA
ncbi:hypothetical protein [Halarsenatibacter silvermanii]|uniref:Nickel transport protein n=1 Tax=Halarsenatibacter silvermanii TaxID=321763 RepID=A0A1G9QL37_9FIRM|nr:hypothetical protein [Halarsenatibacter silvermanii]SDM11712.1 hypothetical protein SAMN04488692_11721 [Halarsenatibacter silvermanii]